MRANDGAHDPGLVHARRGTRRQAWHPARGARLSPGRLAVLLPLLAGVGLFFGLGLQRYAGLEALSLYRADLLAFVAAQGALAAIVFILAYTVIVALSLPFATVLTLAGGFLFGPWLGAAFSVLGATLGAVLVFLAARHALGEPLQAMLERRSRGRGFARVEEGLRQNAFSYLLILRLLPIVPFVVANLLPAFLGMALAPYTLATLVGIVPGGIAYSLVGAGIGDVLTQGGEISLSNAFSPAVVSGMAGLAFLALLPILFRWHRHRRAGRAGRAGAAR